MCTSPRRRRHYSLDWELKGEHGVYGSPREAYAKSVRDPGGQHTHAFYTKSVAPVTHGVVVVEVWRLEPREGHA